MPHINLPHIVSSSDAPEHVHHLVTDLNDVINRINQVLIGVLADDEEVATQIAALDARITALGG